MEILSLMEKAEEKEEKEFSCKKISVWLSFGWARMIVEEGHRESSDLKKLRGR